MPNPLPKIKDTVYNPKDKEQYIVVAHNENGTFWVRHPQTQRLIVMRQGGNEFGTYFEEMKK